MNAEWEHQETTVNAEWEHQETTSQCRLHEYITDALGTATSTFYNRMLSYCRSFSVHTLDNVKDVLITLTVRHLHDVTDVGLVADRHAIAQIPPSACFLYIHSTSKHLSELWPHQCACTCGGKGASVSGSSCQAHDDSSVVWRLLL